MVSAGTGKEGKTKEVVKDRVCMYVCMYVNCATRDDPMTASLPSLTSCSCVVVVCVLELLSATSSWTKTDRQEQHDESLHARNRICHDCSAQRC